MSLRTQMSRPHYWIPFVAAFVGLVLSVALKATPVFPIACGIIMIGMLILAWWNEPKPWRNADAMMTIAITEQPHTDDSLTHSLDLAHARARRLAEGGIDDEGFNPATARDQDRCDHPHPRPRAPQTSTQARGSQDHNDDSTVDGAPRVMFNATLERGPSPLPPRKETQQKSILKSQRRASV